MTNLDGYTNHLLNTLNNVMAQCGENGYKAEVIFKLWRNGESSEFYSEEALRNMLETLADNQATLEAKRRTERNIYDPIFGAEYNRIMERAKK